MEDRSVLGICDDDPEILRKIHRICRDVMDVAGMNLVCVEFRDGSDTTLFARAETSYSRLYIKDGREELYRKNIGRLTGELRGMGTC